MSIHYPQCKYCESLIFENGKSKLILLVLFRRWIQLPNYYANFITQIAPDYTQYEILHRTLQYVLGKNLSMHIYLRQKNVNFSIYIRVS